MIELIHGLLRLAGYTVIVVGTLLLVVTMCELFR